jgi:outer membrane lipoprotein-sorting protein
MSLRIPLILAAVIGAIAPAGAQTNAVLTPEAAQELLKRADQVRFPPDGFELTVSIRTSDAGKEKDARTYRVLSKGNDNTLVMTVKPESERGQIMLMKGRDLWLFLPAVSQPVRLSLAQRLTGQVANGDIARANFAVDYAAQAVGIEPIQGEPAYVLELKAVDRSVAYPRVRYWVRQRDAWPMKSEFYSLSNRLLKTCLYGEFKDVAGRIRPTRLVMTDALRRTELSVMDYSDIRSRELPDRVFTKEYLKKLN